MNLICAQIVFISKWKKQELQKENIVLKFKDKNPSVKVQDKWEHK